HLTQIRYCNGFMVCGHTSFLSSSALFKRQSPKKMCCTRYQKKQVQLNKLKSYVIQEITGYCNMKAVIFRTVKNRWFCADPKKKWVIELRFNLVIEGVGQEKNAILGGTPDTFGVQKIFSIKNFISKSLFSFGARTSTS
uniref:Chemokine interleukin-8-like domain-containing protein n=1 Tax=Gouania willdenowi TaxID=441366 RepID=A0A8C5GHE7_GOUWI